MGVAIGGDDDKNGNNTLLLGGNVREAISENRSARLDESDSIQKNETAIKYVQKRCAINAECV